MPLEPSISYGVFVLSSYFLHNIAINKFMQKSRRCFNRLKTDNMLIIT